MVRLGKEEFERAGGLRAGPGPEEGVWLVCNDYWIVPPMGCGRYVVPCGDRWEEKRPLGEPGLMIELARVGERARDLQDFEEPIIDFVRKRGLLGLSGRVRHGKPTTMRTGEGIERGYEVKIDPAVEIARRETVRGYVTEVIRATAVVGLYEAVLNGDEDLAAEILGNYPRRAPDGERFGDDGRWYGMEPFEHALVEITELVTDMVNAHCNVTAIPPMRSHRVSEVQTGWSFDSLIGAAYLQMYWHVAAQRKVKRCDFCGDLITNPRENRRFCPEKDGIKDKCKNNWHYYRSETSSGKEARKRARQAR
jgi:hypothetical protein